MQLDLASGYDPIELAKAVEMSVSVREGSVIKRWYWRFRGGKWYGGIATADAVGCCLRCGFCWAWRYAWSSRGRYLLSPSEVASKLVSIARSKGYTQARLSGGEPTIAFDHTEEVMEICIGKGLHFVLETNGILIGYDESMARRIARLKKKGGELEVRVSIKGCTPQEFYMLTLAKEEVWWLQLEALKNLVKHGLEPCEEVYPAIMLSFSTKQSQQYIMEKLSEIDPKLSTCIDPEYVFLYPHVKEIMKKRGLTPKIAYKPNQIPKELI